MKIQQTINDLDKLTQPDLEEPQCFTELFIRTWKQHASRPFHCHYALVSLYKQLTLCVHMNAYLCGLEFPESRALTKEVIEKIAAPLKQLKVKLLGLQRTRKWS